jgi:hypothetical protein
MKNVFKRSLVALAVVGSLVGCGQHETVVYQQPAPVAERQPVYVNNPDPMAGVLTGIAIGAIMSNGMRYDGHNGYYDNRYRGPSRTIVRNTTINNVTVNKTTTAPAPVVPAAKVAPVAAPSTPVKNTFANRPTAPVAQKQSFASRPASTPSRPSSGGFSSRRK